MSYQNSKPTKIEKITEFMMDSGSRNWCGLRPFKPLMIVAIIVVIVVIIVFGYLILRKCTVVEYSEENNTLQLSSILFRHGARNPSGTYNSDPYKNYPWPGGIGALTNLGKQQLYTLGKTFRKKYGGYLPDDYNDDDIYIKSSDKSRCMMSAYTFLAGLYPPTSNQTWNCAIPWQPIPVHSLPREMDSLLATKKNCPTFDRHLEQMKNSPELQKFNKEHEELYKNLTLYCNQTMDNPLPVELLFSHLEIQRDIGLKLPNWTDGIFPDKMKDVPGYSLAINSFDDTMKRLKGGPLLSEILNNMKNKVQGNLKPDRKLFVYSAHDLTIVHLWRTLGFEEIILPQFGATLAIELHSIQNSTDSEIKLLYYNTSSTTDPHKLEMPSCGIPCTLTQFENVTRKFISLDWDKECADTTL